MQALLSTAVGQGHGTHSRTAASTSHSVRACWKHMAHALSPQGISQVRHISSQRSLAPQARGDRQRRRDQPWRRRLMLPGVCTASAGNGSSAVTASPSDSASSEAAYADFDWRDQWYPVAFVRDMPEGALTLTTSLAPLAHVLDVTWRSMPDCAKKMSNSPLMWQHITRGTWMPLHTALYIATLGWVCWMH